MKPLISLCMPTNGIIEWVFPVLESIYSQNVDNSLFEVVVTNNGCNDEFHNKMLEYKKEHSNLVYKKTNSFMFYNQLDALKIASGEYLKLINHRGVMVKGSIKRFVELIKHNLNSKPIMYFSNGVFKDEMYNLDSFDGFVKKLGRYASWTTGVGIWKNDYDNLPKDMKIDKISPHSCILFSERKRNSYKIYNFEFSRDIDASHNNKGKYDLFKAFSIEEISITQNLFIDGDISIDTFKSVKNDYKKFLSELYLLFLILKRPCSYDLSSFDDVIEIYFSRFTIIIGAYICAFKMLCSNLRRKIR